MIKPARTPFDLPAMVRVLPSILSADFADARRDIDDARNACAANMLGGDVIHVDVMDGHLVPNISFGPPVIRKLRDALPGVFFDVHLMIDEPMRYAETHIKAGANNLTFHVEAPEVKGRLSEAVKHIRSLKCGVGVTLKPNTPADELFDVIELVDLVLVMSVEPGFGGQAFMPEMLAKCRAIKPKLKSHQVLEIDGGIAPDTIGVAREAGVDWFVVGSSLFGAKDRRAAAAEMAAAIKRA